MWICVGFEKIDNNINNFMDNKKDIELEVIRRFVIKDWRLCIMLLISDRNIGEGFGYLVYFICYLDLRYFKKVLLMFNN